MTPRHWHCICVTMTTGRKHGNNIHIINYYYKVFTIHAIIIYKLIIWVFIANKFLLSKIVSFFILYQFHPTYHSHIPHTTHTSHTSLTHPTHHSHIPHITHTDSTPLVSTPAQLSYGWTNIGFWWLIPFLYTWYSKISTQLYLPPHIHTSHMLHISH